MSKPKIKLRSARHLRSILNGIARHREEAIAVCDAIADLAEPPMEEFKSAARLEEFLSGNGLKVTRPWKARIPTAFRAVAGARRPRIGLMAEYDALPDCGPRPGQYGHGCGHNLLGSGSALAGILAAEALKRIGADGQVVVIGTPAEEILSGKVILAEEGAFKNLDAVISWHPDAKTSVKHAGGQAMDSLSFRFFGRTAHAAAGPHEGRSALDAALLTDVAVNYLREHIEENARIHSVIPNGGSAPNVVPDRAEIWYYIRGRDRQQVDELTQRVTLCARAAAMATETKVRVQYHDSITERIPNWPMTNLLEAIVHRCGVPKFTAADRRDANKAVPHNEGFFTKIQPTRTEQDRASSDDNNVSWFAPMSSFHLTCSPMNVRGHHRENARMTRTSGAHKGMLKAAEIMAMGVLELILNKPLLRKAQAEHKKTMKGRKYKLPPRSDAPRKKTRPKIR